jgi:hypothetical protein
VVPPDGVKISLVLLIAGIAGETKSENKEAQSFITSALFGFSVLVPISSGSILN